MQLQLPAAAIGIGLCGCARKRQRVLITSCNKLCTQAVHLGAVLARLSHFVLIQTGVYPVTWCVGAASWVTQH